MKDLVADVFSITLLVLGVSYLLAHRHWFRLFREITTSPERFLSGAVLMFLAGIMVARGMNEWIGTWPIFITVFGWGMAIEGLVILINPRSLGWFKGISDRFLGLYLRAGGVLLTGLGALLVWHYLL